jgi:uncharacterized protein
LRKPAREWRGDLSFLDAQELMEVDRSLFIDLNEVIQHPGRTIDVDVSTDGITDADLALAGPVTGTLTATGEGNLLRLEGEFLATVVLECSRCGGECEARVEFEVDEAFPIEGVAGIHGGFAVVNDSEEPFPLFEENRLRVEDLLRQLLIVELPVHPLCSENCQGLCTTCGKNLNEGPCDCHTESGHPAMQVLAEKWRKPDGS